VGRGEWGSGSQGKVGQWVAGESGTVGRRVRRSSQVAGCGARRGSQGGVDSPSDGSTSGCVRGKRGRREEKDVRRYRPTLHRRARRGGGFERRGRSTLHRRTHSRGERGLREEVTIHVARMGTLPLGGAGGRGGERRYPSTLHRRAPSSHQDSRERRLSPRRRLRIIGSCSSLNSQKEPIPTQSPPSAARKIPQGRAPVCWRGA
jgi:hypothetical protein